ncbi:MAG TPA: type III polyketide synthase [Acidobacteriaceae bacterium]|nr:type III polyketide synthase [Acidobacteriaceae bacterium]
MNDVYLNRIATAVPDHDVHTAFVDFADNLLSESPDPRMRALFNRMASRSGIQHRYSILSPHRDAPEDHTSEFWINAHRFYTRGSFPDTSNRMEIFERFAPVLMRRAVDRLELTPAERRSITHVVVTTCTGLYAPGLDFDVVDHLGLCPSVERTMIGFMGCYAAINGLKTARHIIRSEPHARVLMVNLELCSLHLQESHDLEQVLSFLLFADGCAASILSAEPIGLALDSFRAVTIPETRELITWKIRGLGFDMFLSGQVPSAIAKGLESCSEDIVGPFTADDITLWGVHPGGRTILDGVERGLGLPPEALTSSRSVLERFGNMSSATVMFVLDDIMRTAQPGERGCAMSFGPGLTAETMLFHAA